MPKNYKMTLCINKLQGAFVCNLKGRKETKRCVCIPIEDADLFEADNGSVYLNGSVFEMREEKYGKSHLIKQSLSKDRYDAMTEEERREIPIIGNLSPMEERQRETPAGGPTMDLSEDDDLPF